MSADRNLLFGMLALHAGLISREQLLEGFNAWMLAKETPLGELLRQRGALDEKGRAMLDGLVDCQLSKHGDARKSLASLRVEPQVLRDLEQLADPDVQESVAALPTPTPGTGNPWPVPTAPAPDSQPSVLAAVRYRRLRHHAKGGLGKEGRTLLLKLVKNHPALPEYQNDLARTHNNLGLLLRALGKKEEAAMEYEQARTLQQKLIDNHPDLPEYQQDLARTQANLGNLLSDQGKREEAAKEYEQARTLQQTLVKDYPNVPEYQNDLVRTLVNLSHLLLKGGKPAEALPVLDQAVSLLQAARWPDPHDATYRHFLRNAHLGRALTLGQLGQNRQADPEWEKALQLSPEVERTRLRFDRADSRARGGDYRRSAEEAAELSRLMPPAGILYNLACIQALNAANAIRDPARPLPEREKRAEEYARQAVALLRRADAAGQFRESAKVAHIDKDTDLTSLRDRADFRAFRATLKPAKP
jgi:tetratricopeptide (TPR) repeat protein